MTYSVLHIFKAKEANKNIEESVLPSFIAIYLY